MLVTWLKCWVSHSISTAWDNPPIQQPVYFVYICLSVTLEELPVMDVGWCRELTWNQKFLSSKDWSVLRFVQSDANPIRWRLACTPTRTELYYTVWILRFSCAPSSIPGSSLLQSLVISNEIIYITLAQRTDCHDWRVQAIVPASQTMRRRKGWLMRSRRGEGASWWLVWCMRKRLCGKWYSLGKSITYH